MLELKNIWKRYVMGENTLQVLQGVSLTIAPGEFVALMGPSGSGKSTLLNILGLLDVPDEGSYRLNGFEVATLDEDALALQRRRTIGFVFQQFHLLPRLSAIENTTLPLLYTEHDTGSGDAEALLARMGLGERLHHKPNELSGGQQQRIAIARSLINKPLIVLADEPTGNLDSKSGKEILEILKELNREGITIVLVTHEEGVGRQAQRIIRMRDGKIESDERLASPPQNAPQKQGGKNTSLIDTAAQKLRFSDALEHGKQGLRTLAANKVRSFLSMLGILIGVAAVVAMLALGHGAQKAIETQLASLGSNLLVVRPGNFRMGGVALDAGAVTRLTLEDAESIPERISGVVDISPSVSGRGQITFANKNWSSQLMGTTASYAPMHAAEPEIGRFFTEEENQQRKRVAVLGPTVVRELFGEANPVGETIKINKVNFQVIGVLPPKGSSSWRDQDDLIALPLLTAMHRLLGKDYLDSMDVEMAEGTDTSAAQKELMALMLSRHRVPQSQQQDAFQVRNMADVQAALTESNRTLSLLLACIAAISLLVGGIGIMNIMLVSVTERTREIGLRKAVGARKADILAQFLAEAVVVSVLGGAAGILLGWLITQILALFAGWATSVSPWAVLLASAFSISIGIIFGIYPAKKAAALKPIDALRYE